MQQALVVAVMSAYSAEDIKLLEKHTKTYLIVRVCLYYLYPLASTLQICQPPAQFYWSTTCKEPPDIPR